MAVSSTKLTIMPFPQYWDGAVLKLNVLVLPHEDPTVSLAVNLPTGVDAPEFANAQLKLNAMIIDSLDMMPRPVDVTAVKSLVITPPTNSLDLFKELAKSFKITKPSNIINPVNASTFIQKYLPKSYRTSFSFSQPRTPYAKTDDSYHCAMRDKKSVPPPVYSTDEVSWGKVFALSLRQPVLARKLGFVYEAEVNLPPDTYQDGGWLYIDLDVTSDYHAQVLAQPDIVKLYAVRIPALTTPRVLFAPVQFPVSNLPVSGNYDPIFIEAEDYDDGFAKITHCMQPVSANLLLEPDQASDGLPPTRDFGIRLGWDDEQLLIWQNRQMTVDPDFGIRLDAPMGIFNYRIDVRKNGDDDTHWNSLTRVKGELVLNGIDLGTIENAELGVEVGPVQLDGQKQGIFWLPLYYTQWTGTSLIIKDEKAATLAGTDPILKKQMQAVNGERVPLLYGETYDFRVRYADITGGGPLESHVPVNGAPSSYATCRFRRYLPPQKVRVSGLDTENAPIAPPISYEIYRPLLGYPSLLFTGLPNAYDLLLADLPNAINESREAGYPDPDVSYMQIDVDIKAPEMDTLLADNSRESYYHLFTTTRAFPTDLTQPFNLQVEFHEAAVVKFGDEADLGDLPLTTDTSALKLPTARDIRIRISPLCKEDQTLVYFGGQKTRIGNPISVYTRAESQNEQSLFINESPARQFQTILLQPDPSPTPNLAALMVLGGQATDSAGNIFQRFAEQLHLDNSGMSLFGKPGQRVVFGCAKGIRHTLSPEHATITFANKTDIVHQWIPTIILDIQRDWSWDSLDLTSFEIRRNGTDLVGTIELKNTVSITALHNADRSRTTIIFFDAVDPKEFPGTFPKPMDLKYTVTAKFKHAPSQLDPDKDLSMTIPVAVSPAQIPKIVSAGIALSPYTRSEDYSSTEVRKRAVWIEFEEPIENPDDDYFAFVKAYSPDPLLLVGNEPIQDPKENIPFLPPEEIRVITDGQSDDRAGLNAWQQLIPCTQISPRHFLISLPPGINADSPELFGFFVYEFCVGHSKVWCTAQSRFGRSIRVTGLQHPAPQMACSVIRTDDAIILSAQYATPVFEGQSLGTANPKTEIWGVLYTQVMQVDGKDFRNILLREKRTILERKHIDRGRHATNAKNGICGWTQGEVLAMLRHLGLPDDSPLSVMAIEMVSNYENVNEPLSGDLGKMRIYRTSILVQVPEICVT